MMPGIDSCQGSNLPDMQNRNTKSSFNSGDALPKFVAYLVDQWQVLRNRSCHFV